MARFAARTAASHGSPRRIRSAARHTRRRTASASDDMSAIMSWIIWNDASGRPNCRLPGVVNDRIETALDDPEPVATVTRPLSREYIAILKPSPSAPSIALAGTRGVLQNKRSGGYDGQAHELAEA